MSQIIRLKDGREAAVRPFSAGDKGSVVEMFASMNEESLKWAMPPYSAERLERGWWSNLDTLIALVTQCEDRVVGYAQVSRSPLPRRRGIGEFLIYLHQDFHDVGLGTEMTRKIIEVARLQRLHRIGLDVVADNHIAIRVYEKLGFTREGTCRDAYFGDDGRYHDLVYMGLLLDRSDNEKAN